MNRTSDVLTRVPQLPLLAAAVALLVAGACGDDLELTLMHSCSRACEALSACELDPGGTCESDCVNELRGVTGGCQTALGDYATCLGDAPCSQLTGGACSDASAHFVSACAVPDDVLDPTSR
jgi:hypothetical protein